MKHGIGVINVLAVLGAGVAHAQPPTEPPSVGQRVRITTSPEARPLVGMLRQVGDRQLVVDDGKGALTSVLTTDVRKIEIGMGKRSNVKRGAIIGGAVG